MENNPQKPITAEAVIEELGMNWNEAQRQEYLGSIEVLYFQKLAVPYPTSNYYVAATAAGYVYRIKCFICGPVGLTQA